MPGIGIQIGARPDSGFDDPIGMLKDCHRRIEHFLGVLCLVAENALSRTLQPEERSAAEAALHYFHVGGRRHTADEEESLFPRLTAHGATADLENLQHDHDEAEKLHVNVEQLYTTWFSTGSLSEQDQQQLLSATSRLRALYAEHIALEDNVIFPRAAQVLAAAEIKTLGEEFRARRI
ncbi:MAG: hemerythrin domain-containing protein [Acidobacteriota bacterium]|nr:hemerythrin domain-containing protein [Acidobacteriota bacterium]